MIILVVLSIITVVLLWYALWGRDWLKSKEGAQGFFARIEPIEIFLFKKSQTILVARLLQFLGSMLTILTWLGEIPIDNIMPLVPERHQALVRGTLSCLPLTLNGLGAIVENLRNKTSTPIDLIALPDKVVAESPKLKEAVAMADATKVEAVTVAAVAVEQAKAA